MKLGDESDKSIIVLLYLFIDYKYLNIKFIKLIYFVNTIATASFRILSPNTNIYKIGSMSKALNIARVATGSTAETSEPKAKLVLASNGCIKVVCPSKKIPDPITNALIAVPNIAKTNIDPKF